MKKLAALFLLLAGCSAAQQQQEKKVLIDVLTATQYACVLDHQFDFVPANSTPGAVIAVACGMEPALATAVDKFLAVGHAYQMSHPALRRD